MVSTFCHAGGTNIRRARNKSIPPPTRISSMLSKLEESEPVRFTIGFSSVKPGKSGFSNLGVRAIAQLRFAVMVLISPLCAK